MTSSGLAVPGDLPAEARSQVRRNTEFALSLYGELKHTPGNLFFSPYSISTCLAMTYAGARGETEKQMARALHFATDQQRFHTAFGELQRQLGNSAKDVQLNVANALWTQEGHAFLPEFLKTAQGSYEANLNQADFRTGAEAARSRINGWVADKTHEKIRELLPAGSVNAMTRLVLANAIYFKGAWLKPYKKTETSDQPFHLSSTKEAKVALMHHLDDVRYTENADFQAVELPYQGGDLSMVVLLPRQVGGLALLENRLSAQLLTDTLSQMRQQKVEIFLPRFKLESGFNLNDSLSRLGMPDAFGAKADFSGIDGTRQLFISGVFHKAWGEVNEEGTEAAAATGVSVGLLAVMKPLPPPVFRADHPFVFLIRDTRSGTILFLGRLADPASSATGS